MAAAKPAHNLLTWLSSVMTFPDDSQQVISGVHQIIEDALECLTLVDYAVMSMPSASAKILAFDVAVKPLDQGYFVAFHVQFRVL